MCFRRWMRKRWRGWWSSTRTLFSAQWCRTAREPWRELIKWAGAPTHQTLRSYCWSAHTYTTHDHIATQREGALFCVQTTNAQYLQLRHVCISFTVQTFMSTHCYTPVWSFRSQNVATEAIFHFNNPTKIGLLVFYTKRFLVPVLYHSYTLFSTELDWITLIISSKSYFNIVYIYLTRAWIEFSVCCKDEPQQVLFDGSFKTEH